MTGRGGDEGFTLIEILVTLVLLGLMAVLTVNVFQQLRAIRSIESRFEASSEAATVVAYIATELSHAMAISLSGSESRAMPPLEGTSTSVRFVAATRSGFQDDALREIAFSLESENGASKIVRRTRSRSGDSSTADGHSDELLEGVARFELFYRSTVDGEVWIEQWQSQDDLPAAIRIRLVDTRSGAIVSRTVLIAAGVRKPKG